VFNIDFKKKWWQSAIPKPINYQELSLEKKFGASYIESKNRSYSENISQTYSQRGESFKYISTHIENLDVTHLSEHTSGGNPVRKYAFISEVQEHTRKITFFSAKENLTSVFQNGYLSYISIYNASTSQSTLDGIRKVNNYTFFSGSASFETAMFKFYETVNVPRSIPALKSMLILAGKSEVLTEIGSSEVLALSLGFSIFNGCYFAFQTPGTFTAFLNEVINRCPEPVPLEIPPYRSNFLIISPHSPPVPDLGQRGVSIFKIVGDRKYTIISGILSLGAAGFGLAKLHIISSFITKGVKVLKLILAASKAYEGATKVTYETLKEVSRALGDTLDPG